MTKDKRAPRSKMFINIPIHSQEESFKTPFEFQVPLKASRSVAFLKNANQIAKPQHNSSGFVVTGVSIKCK